MRNYHKKLAREDKFARHYYCNAARFIPAMKRANSKAFRRFIKADCCTEG